MNSNYNFSRFLQGRWYFSCRKPTFLSIFHNRRKMILIARDVMEFYDGVKIMRECIAYVIQFSNDAFSKTINIYLP